MYSTCELRTEEAYMLQKNRLHHLAVERGYDKLGPETAYNLLRRTKGTGYDLTSAEYCALVNVLLLADVWYMLHTLCDLPHMPQQYRSALRRELVKKADRRSAVDILTRVHDLSKEQRAQVHALL
jgi:hypothetical protein